MNAESGQSCSWSIVASFLRQHVLELHGFDLTQPTRMVTEFSEARMRVIDTTALQCQIHQPLLALRRRVLFTTYLLKTWGVLSKYAEGMAKIPVGGLS